jgi:hypothetical protein
MTLEEPFGRRLDPLGPDDRLFNTGGPWQSNVKADMPFLRDYRYVEGFRRATELLGEHALAHRVDVDALAMPILFCYRQWMELRLKDLLVAGRKLAEEEAEPLYTHDLNVLWRRVRPIIEKAWADEGRDALDPLEAVINELAELDGPTGTGFRYALDRSGGPSLPDDLQINLQNVAMVMAKVGILLDGAAEGIGQMLEWQREMYDDFRGD